LLTPFLQNNFGRETLFFYLQGLLLQVSGVSIFSLRFASVLAGILTIPLLYAGRQRWGQVNTPLTGVLFDAHRWPVSLIVPDRHQ
jgi:4-amino-4-deoxy-L-arabinose transferase-like glycosyltransferase